VGYRRWSTPLIGNWLSYHGNTLDKHIALLTAHHCYQSLGTDQEERKRAYRALFEHNIPALTLQEIRDATNRTWVLGGNRFNQQIERQMGRRSEPLAKGGDRRPKTFREIT
jgi:putative transposase